MIILLKKANLLFFFIFVSSILEISFQQSCAGGNVCGDGYCCKFSSSCQCSHVVCREMCYHGDTMPNEMHHPALTGQYDNKMINSKIISIDGDINDYYADPDYDAFNMKLPSGGGASDDKAGGGDEGADGEENQADNGDGGESKRRLKRLSMAKSRRTTNPSYYIVNGKKYRPSFRKRRVMVKKNYPTLIRKGPNQSLLKGVRMNDFKAALLQAKKMNATKIIIERERKFRFAKSKLKKSESMKKFFSKNKKGRLISFFSKKK